MKPLVALAAVLFAASHTFAASTGITLTQAAPKKPTEAKPAAPADATAPVVPPVVKKEVKPAVKPAPAPEPVIPGTVLPRSNGTFLGFEVLAGKVTVSFYDKKKKPMAPDVARGLARWKDPRGPGVIRTPMNASGTALVAVANALPPFNYSIDIQFLQGDGEDAQIVESYTVPFRG